MVLNTGSLVPDWSKVEARLLELLEVNMNKIKLVNYFTYLAKNEETNYKVNQIQFANIKSYFLRILDVMQSHYDYSNSAKFIYLTQYFCYEKTEKIEDSVAKNPFDESLCFDTVKD
jgi:hypothetical protein